MDATARDFNQNLSANTSGLDDLFEVEVGPGNTKDYQVGPTAGLPVKEAAKLLGLSIKTVKDKLRKGTLIGFKKRDKYGETWLVSPNQEGVVVPSSTWESLPTPADQGDAGVPGTTWQSLPQKTETELTVLVDLLEKKERELEAASYRIGYLESQLETERQQVKLLTDSQHRSGWWAKFMTWFLGTQ